MANSYEPYLADIRRSLSSALCLYDLPCQHVERYSRPEVEFDDSPDLLLPSVVVSRNEREKCLIERSVNSVRFSIQVKQDHALEVWLTRRLMSFLTQSSYAEAFGIMRRKSVPGYDLSLVITAKHCLTYGRQALVDFICRFVQDFVSAYGLKMLVTSRGRAVAAEYLHCFDTMYNVYKLSACSQSENSSLGATLHVSMPLPELSSDEIAESVLRLKDWEADALPVWV